MNLIYDLIMEVLENTPWFVLAYALHVISKVQPRELMLSARGFMFQWYK